MTAGDQAVPCSSPFSVAKLLLRQRISSQESAPLSAQVGHRRTAVDFPKADEVDGSRSRHLSAKLGCCQANPSKKAIHHGDYDNRPFRGAQARAAAISGSIGIAPHLSLPPSPPPPLILTSRMAQERSRR